MTDQPIDTARENASPPTAEIKSSARPRLYFIDNLRIVLITLVAPLVVALCFMIAHYLRRLPLVRNFI